MRKLSLTLNIVLLLLVGYLYYLHFYSGNSKSQSGTEVEKVSDNSAGNGFKIAYIDLDSLQNKYDFYQTIKKDVDQKTAAANNQIMALQNRYQARSTDLQKKAATMTPQQQEGAMNEINKMQQDFQAQKQNLDNELFDYNSKMKQEIINRIEAFLKDFNKDHKYAFVFSYEPGFMYYKDSTLNITPEVIAGLNESYKKENK